jgi:hypothetical protein
MTRLRSEAILAPPFGLALPADLFDTHAVNVILEYAGRLAGWSDQRSFPRSMTAIAEELEHRVVSASLPLGTRGVRTSYPKPTIITADAETLAAQQRTVAHEIFHPFVGVEHRQYQEVGGRLTRLQARVEALCDIGAAELHVPQEEMRRQLISGVGIRRVPDLAEHFGSSLSATLKSMVLCADEPLAGLVFEVRHKPRDNVPSSTGQQVLWGQPRDFDAPKRLRVHDWTVSRLAEHARFNRHQHVEEGTAIYRALTEGCATDGIDDLTSLGFGRHRTESWPHRFGETTRVLTVIRLWAA